MFNKILVPLDGSVLAEAALPFAEEVAGKLGSEVTLLYISDPVNDPYRHMYDPYLQKISEAVKETGKNSPNGKEISADSRIMVGEAAEQITSYAENKDIDLIVMSSHGHSGYKRWTLGHITDKVIRNTTRPVAIIRSKSHTKHAGISRVMVTLDGSKVSETALPYASNLAAGLKAELLLFEVLTPDYYAYTNEAYKELAEAKRAAHNYVEKIAADLKDKGITVNTELQEGLVSDTPEMIIQMTEEAEIDTVVMATHGRSGLSRWALGSAAEKVLRGIEAPLILVKPPLLVR
ncbi:MAG: universal stress protein [Dehalococcoidales bacterium]|nr:universal stress protein [Dehalococcoidales bacterium]